MNFPFRFGSASTPKQDDKRATAAMRRGPSSGATPLCLVAALLATGALSGCGNSAASQVVVEEAVATMRRLSSLPTPSPTLHTPREPVSSEREGVPAPGQHAPANMATPQALPPDVATLNLALNSSGRWAAQIQTGPLKPLPGGAGIVVCEPMDEASKPNVTKPNAAKTDAAKADAAGNKVSLTDFGAGCGRWLHLEGGGRGAMGQTPLWGGIDDARLEMKRPDLRLNTGQAAQLARKIGVTFVATGRIQGDEKRYVLTYQVWKMPERKAVGAPLSAGGTPAQIVQSLPFLARRMAALPGMSTQDAAAAPQGAIAEKVADLALLGAVPWKARRPIPDAQAAALRVLSTRSALAGLLLMRSRTLGEGDPFWPVLIKRLFTLAPRNCLVVGDAAWNAPQYVTPYKSVWSQDQALFPDNYLLANGDMSWQRWKGNRAAERMAAELAVRCAPRNPAPWLQLGETISSVAQDTRKSRYSTQLSQAESRKVARLYPQALVVSLQAARLDPGSAYAWKDVSTAAAFNGQGDIADAALCKSLAINRGEQSALWWGLQLYQPKWYGDRAKLKQVAALAMSDYEMFSVLYDDLIGAFQAANMDAEAQSALMGAVAMFENAARVTPKDPTVHWRWAMLAKTHGHDGSKDDVAISEFRNYIALRPDDAQALYELGWMLHYKKRVYPEAEVLYRRAIVLRPQFDDAINALADITYYVHGNAKAAEALYRRALSINDDGLYHAELARLLLDQNRRDEATSHAKKALALGYDDTSNPIFARLGLNP